MNDYQANPTNKKLTSFHALALNIIYSAILILSHYAVPYIHELVNSFFSGWFLLISVIVFVYFNALVRSSSILLFSYLSLIFRIGFALFVFSLVLIAVAFITNTIEIIERDKFIYFLVSIFICQSLAMLIVKSFYTFFVPISKKNIALITNVGEMRNDKLNNFLSSDLVDIEIFSINLCDELIEYSAENRVEAVYIYIDSKNLNELEIILNKLSIYAFEIYWVLPESIFTNSVNSQEIKPIRLNHSPINLDANQYLLKRSLDVVGSLIILFFAFPAILVASLLIKLTDNGPILHKQDRHGLHGKTFEMLKLRSMSVGSDKSKIRVTDTDSRVTFIGKIIRRTSFDEIPQLINILRGDMSLVGPRPHILSDTEYYSEKILTFLTRHQVKPGLTGLAQITARGKTDSVIAMQKKLDQDIDYINNWSIYLDIRILIRTPFSIWANRKSNL